MNAPHPRPRRWLQFSLRTLFVVMLLVAAFFGGRESMRPAIRAERLEAEQARYEAMIEQTAALLERNRALVAEQQSRAAIAAAAALDDQQNGQTQESGVAPTATEGPKP